MNRASFGGWGADLDEPTFARALAVMGVLAAREAPDAPAAGLPPAASAAQLATELTELIAQVEAELAARDDERHGIVLPWTDPRRDPLWEDLAPLVDAGELAAAWQLRGARFRIPSVALDGDGLHPGWVTGRLTSDAVGGGSAAVLPDVARRPARWQWPMRVGFLPDPRSQELHAHAATARDAVHFMPDLTRLLRMGPSPACDLLLAPMSLERTLAAVLETPLRAAVVVVAQAHTDRWRHTRPLLDALRSVTKASVVAFTGGIDPVEWLVGFVEAFAHDLPMDVAFFAPTHHLSTTGRLLVADEAFLAQARVSRQAAAVLADLERMEMAPPTAGAAPPPMVEPRVRAILRNSDQLTFDHETQGATKVARAEGEAREQLERPQPRWLQAQVLAAQPDGTAAAGGAEIQLHTFAPDALHAVDVRIGLEDQGWTSLADTFPAHELPDDAAEHRLTVVMTEPELLAEPLVGELLLPRVGSSAPTRFMLRTRADTTDVRARIIVSYGNRVLQTAVLRGGVEGRTDDPQIRLERETVVRVHTHDLAERRRFDAALVLNHGDDGIPRATALVDARAAVVNVGDSDVVEAARLIRERFEEIVEAPEDFAALDAPGTIDLLLFLATRGALLREALAIDFLGEALAAAERLQLVAARSEAYLPIEFCYDLPAPNPGAQLCPSAAVALSARASCPGPHDATVVCPLGFWALTKVIERHAFQPGDPSRPDHGYLVRSEPTSSRRLIDLGGPTLFAASDRVDGHQAGTLERLRAQLAEATGGRSTCATSWAEWLEQVRAAPPSVMLLLPHTTFEDNLEVYGLEIGATERLWGSQIAADHVHGGDERPAVVLLLGCATADGPITYEDFPGRFRRSGAEIFVGTLPKILGRHAAPVGELVVRLLAERADQAETTFGDLMLELRRRSLAEGVPMALALVAYGDADWVLGSAS